MQHWWSRKADGSSSVLHLPVFGFLGCFRGVVCGDFGRFVDVRRHDSNIPTVKILPFRAFGQHSNEKSNKCFLKPFKSEIQNTADSADHHTSRIESQTLSCGAEIGWLEIKRTWLLLNGLVGDTVCFCCRDCHVMEPTFDLLYITS